MFVRTTSADGSASDSSVPVFHDENNKAADENHQIANFKAHQELISAARSLPFDQLVERLKNLEPLSHSQHSASEYYGLPLQNEESLFDTVLKNQNIDAANKFQLLNHMNTSLGYSTYMYLLFEEPTVNSLLALNNESGALMLIYMNAVTNHSLTMKPLLEEKVWRQIIKTGNAYCGALLERITTSFLPAQRILDFVELWRDLTVNKANPQLISDFYKEIFELTEGASNELVNLLRASQFKLNRRDEVIVIDQPPIQQAPTLDYPQFKEAYLQLVKNSIDANDFKPDTESWKQFIEHQDSETLLQFANQQKENFTKRQLIISFLSFWINNTPDAAAIHLKVYNYYETCLAKNLASDIYPYESELWDALSKTNPRLEFGEKLFHMLLNHHCNPEKMLEYISIWLKYCETVNDIHDAYRHGVKFDQIIDMTSLHSYIHEIKEIAQVRGLEWMYHHDRVVVSDHMKKWLTSSSHLFSKHSPDKIYHLITDGKKDEAQTELAAYKTTVEKHIDKHYAKTKELQGQHFKF